MAGPPPGSMARHPSGLDPEPARRRKRSRWALLGAVLGAVGLLTVLLSFGLSRDPTIIRSALIGGLAPDFSLPTLDGSRTVRLSDFHGQVVVLNFWASWCADCRVEHPDLSAAWRRYRDRGVVLMGVAFQDRESSSRAFIAELGGDWPQLSDPGSRTALAFGVYGVPETFVIGPDGRVAFKQIGPVGYERLSEEITKLLPESSP
jgi:cytochrome c biogenesis protein CcmG, thiol:disulfide interchange protein DsbE